MVSPPETFTDVLSTLCIVYREREKKEWSGVVIVYFYLTNIINSKHTIIYQKKMLCLKNILDRLPNLYQLI